MSIHILCLDFLLLFLCAYPSGVSASFSHFFRGRNFNSYLKIQMFILLIGTISVAMVLSLFEPFIWGQFTKFPQLKFLVWTFPVAIFCIIIEHIMNIGFTFYKTKRWVWIPSVHSDWKESISIESTLMMLGIAVAEEVIFRGFMISHLHERLWISLLASLVISSLLYGLNHLYFGLTNVGNKFFSGLVYGALYLISTSIWIPVLVHCFQNILVVLVGRKVNE